VASTPIPLPASPGLIRPLSRILHCDRVRGKSRSPGLPAPLAGERPLADSIPNVGGCGLSQRHSHPLTTGLLLSRFCPVSSSLLPLRRQPSVGAPRVNHTPYEPTHE